MSWTLTITGREHYLSGDKAVAADNVPGLPEIAHSLAQINRFTGHCKRPYSVAEHSLLVYQFAVADGADTKLKFAALMHDAHECICGDMATPIKHEVGYAWGAFEDYQQASVLEHYLLADVSRSYAHEIRRWDLEALATERRDLTAFNPALHAPWPVIDTPGRKVLPAPTPLMTQWRMDFPWMGWRDRFHTEALLLLERIELEEKGAA
jgi:uncharacterized protein